MLKKILVVDDEEAIREIFSRALRSSGFEVITAPSAEDALELLKKETPQVMFLDLNLPGMDGVELARRVRASNPMTLLYAFTGYVSLFELANCREAGFDDYFTKPVDMGLLRRVAAEAFEKVERWRRQ
ncbi:MAG: response regulator [Deltaproteobacteria bacterium]|nr:response regulator [Deltaproteobacteria bacterium]